MNADSMVEPLYPLTQQILFYTCLRSYITKGGLSIILPLRPSNTLHAYSAHPFPQEHNGSSTLFTLQLDKPLILKKVGESAIAVPNPSHFNECLHPEPRSFVCYTPGWSYDTDTPTCHRALIEQPHSVTSQCNFREIHPSKTPYFLPLADVSLLYYFYPTPATVTCTNRLPMKLITGVFLLPHNCELQSLSMTLPAMKRYVTSFESTILNIPPGNIELPSFNGSVKLAPLHFVDMDPVQEVPWALTEFNVDYIYPLAVTFIGMLACAGILIAFLIHTKNKNIRQARAVERLSTPGIM